VSSSAGHLLAKVQPAAAVEVPRVESFLDFLRQFARVKITSGPEAGHYRPYTFEGREPLIEVCQTLDSILGQAGAEPLKDATLVLAGGAQFGKTVLELHLAAYLACVRFLSPGVYLPDDTLADSIVDAKFRPDVVDQIPWVAEMTRIGKAVNQSGKAVNTKGAFLVTDGQRKSVGLFRGLKKIPTSFSLDVVVRDEEDDIPPAKAKFLSGRLTASALRLQIIVGTQRIHGAGQNKQWESGSQGVVEIRCPACRKWWNPEDEFPRVLRLAMDGAPSPTDPRLGYEGDFRRPDRPDVVMAQHAPDAPYYLACPDCGSELERNAPRWTHRRPDRIRQRRWSYRISQLGCPAIELTQIVAHWTRAVADGGEMLSFCCDRLAKPKSASQALTPEILDRARGVEVFDFGTRREEASCFAGLDTGDRCWLVTRESAPFQSRRIIRADAFSLADVVERVRALWALYGFTLFIDERPAVHEARTLALMLNGLDALTQWPRVDWGSRDAHFSAPSGLSWDGRLQRWRGLKCALVRFSRHALGDGITQTAAEFDSGGQRCFVPLIECNRYESIDRAVREFLTPRENVIEVVTDRVGKRVVRQQPAVLLPRRVPGSPAALETLDAHLLAGSQRLKDERTGELGDYCDGIENHLLLADTYAALAELVGGESHRVAPFRYQPVQPGRRNPRRAIT
jgi:hypothetical protein